MPLSGPQIQLWAEQLYAARSHRLARQPITLECAEFDEASAYLVQQQLFQLYADAAVGFKLGFTGAAMRRQMGVATPNFGRLSKTMRIEGGKAKFANFIHPKIEPEIALVTSEEIRVAANNPLDLGTKIKAAHPAIEIVDSRFIDYKFRAEDNIADNSSAAAFALGQPFDLATEKLDNLQVRLLRNGEPLGVGKGTDALGGPLSALNWLVKKLHAVGEALPANSLVLTGGLTKAETVHQGDEFIAEFGNNSGAVAVCFD